VSRAPDHQSAKIQNGRISATPTFAWQEDNEEFGRVSYHCWLGRACARNLNL
jgi:hypothetical protein